jgi:hypothetical protein
VTDVAGVVVSVGPSANGFQAGDQVVATARCERSSGENSSKLAPDDKGALLPCYSRTPLSSRFGVIVGIIRPTL